MRVGGWNKTLGQDCIRVRKKTKQAEQELSKLSVEVPTDTRSDACGRKAKKKKPFFFFID